MKIKLRYYANLIVLQISLGASFAQAIEIVELYDEHMGVVSAITSKPFFDRAITIDEALLQKAIAAEAAMNTYINNHPGALDTKAKKECFSEILALQNNPGYAVQPDELQDMIDLKKSGFNGDVAAFDNYVKTIAAGSITASQAKTAKRHLLALGMDSCDDSLTEAVSYLQVGNKVISGDISVSNIVKKPSREEIEATYVLKTKFSVDKPADEQRIAYRMLKKQGTEPATIDEVNAAAVLVGYAGEHTKEKIDAAHAYVRGGVPYKQITQSCINKYVEVSKAGGDTSAVVQAVAASP